MCGLAALGLNACGTPEPQTEKDTAGEKGKQECNCLHGICKDGVCQCEAGYFGPKCAECTKGAEDSYYGKDECTFTDNRDGYVYPVVKINDQIWMAKNMAHVPSGKYPDSDYFYPGNMIENVKDYGNLYLWDAATDVCPEGWTLPQKEDFENILSKLGCNNVEFCEDADVIAKLRAADEILGDFKGTDITGLALLPSGSFWGEKEGFADFGVNANLWSATLFQGNQAYGMFVSSEDAVIDHSGHEYAFAVRCILHAD